MPGPQRTSSTKAASSPTRPKSPSRAQRGTGSAKAKQYTKTQRAMKKRPLKSFLIGAVSKRLNNYTDMLLDAVQRQDVDFVRSILADPKLSHYKDKVITHTGPDGSNALSLAIFNSASTLEIKELLAQYGAVSVSDIDNAEGLEPINKNHLKSVLNTKAEKFPVLKRIAKLKTRFIDSHLISESTQDMIDSPFEDYSAGIKFYDKIDSAPQPKTKADSNANIKRYQKARLAILNQYTTTLKKALKARDTALIARLIHDSELENLFAGVLFKLSNQNPMFIRGDEKIILSGLEYYFKVSKDPVFDEILDDIYDYKSKKLGRRGEQSVERLANAIGLEDTE